MRRHLLHQVDVALVGGKDVHRDGPEQGIAGFFKHDGLADVIEPQPAVLRRGVRREQSGLARQGDKFAAEVLGRAVRGLPLVGFKRDDGIADEGTRAALQVLQFGGEGEVHARGHLRST